MEKIEKALRSQPNIKSHHLYGAKLLILKVLTILGGEGEKLSTEVDQIRLTSLLEFSKSANSAETSSE